MISRPPTRPSRFVIARAADVGFYVMDGAPTGLCAEIVCAGTLGECLKYIEDKLTPPTPAEPACSCRSGPSAT